VVEKSFQQFRAQQTTHGGKVTAADKQELRRRLNSLGEELDGYLAGEYGIDSQKLRKFAEWKASHQPFHWFVEFYGIMANGGFDCVIGNPPYVEKAKLGGRYHVHGYETQDCRDIYAWCVERSVRVVAERGRLGLIIPVSIVSSANFAPLRRTVATDHSLWMAHFANRPGQLFAGAQSRLTIVLRSHDADPVIHSTRYHRWDARNGERDHLLTISRYVSLPTDICSFHGLIPKVGQLEPASVLGKIICKATVNDWLIANCKHAIYWVRVPGYFCQFFLRPPMAKPERGGPAKERGEVNRIYCASESAQRALHAILNSSLYYQFFCAFTDGRHLNPSDIREFPCDQAKFHGTKAGKTLAALSTTLEDSMRENTSFWRKSGLLIESVDSRKTKAIIDEIDAVLADSFGFTPEELDFIINYDIKYRVGAQDSDTDE
jgi:hypothetical protein